MLEINHLSSNSAVPDAALLALGRELEDAIAAERALGAELWSREWKRANDRVWQAIDAIAALDAATDSGRLVKARAVARAHMELASVPADDLADDERALASLVRAFFPEKSRANPTASAISDRT